MKRCEICGKGRTTGNNVSHSMRHTKRTFEANIQKVDVEINGKKYLDGGIADSVPIQYFESIGFEKNVIILTQPKGYSKKPSAAAKIMKYALKEYPNVVKTMENRHIEYNETLAYIEEREKAGAVYVIRPEAPLEIGRVEHNPDVMQRVYDIGRKVAEEHLKNLKSFLK